MIALAMQGAKSLLLLFILCSSALAQVSHEDVWRVTSRLGYGPTQMLLNDVTRAGDVRNWALSQIDAAHAASQKAPVVPSWTSLADLPLIRIFPEFVSEREARKAGQEKLQKTPDAGPSTKGNVPFSTRVARDAAAWWVVACSRPDIENLLLARMTEFWFNGNPFIFHCSEK